MRACVWVDLSAMSSVCFFFFLAPQDRCIAEFHLSTAWRRGRRRCDQKQTQSLPGVAALWFFKGCCIQRFRRTSLPSAKLKHLLPRPKRSAGGIDLLTAAFGRQKEQALRPRTPIPGGRVRKPGAQRQHVQSPPRFPVYKEKMGAHYSREPLVGGWRHPSLGAVDMATSVIVFFSNIWMWGL